MMIYPGFNHWGHQENDIENYLLHDNGIGNHFHNNDWEIYIVDNPLTNNYDQYFSLIHHFGNIGINRIVICVKQSIAINHINQLLGIPHIENVDARLMIGFISMFHPKRVPGNSDIFEEVRTMIANHDNLHRQHQLMNFIQECENNGIQISVKPLSPNLWFPFSKRFWCYRGRMILVDSHENDLILQNMENDIHEEFFHFDIIEHIENDDIDWGFHPNAHFNDNHHEMDIYQQLHQIGEALNNAVGIE